jgi:signal transduction histidine kinase
MLRQQSIKDNQHSSGASQTRALQLPAKVNTDTKQVQGYLYLFTIIAITLILAILFHQFLLPLWTPLSTEHSFIHTLLVSLAVLLIITLGIVWASYLLMSSHQKILNHAYIELEEGIDRRTELLTESQSLWGSLFNAFEERVVVVDPNMQIIKANNTAKTSVGFDPSGHLFAEAFPPCQLTTERRSELRLIQHTFESGKSQRDRLLRGGQECATALSIDTYPVFCEDGTPRMVIEIARDVMQQVKTDMRDRHQEKMVALGMLAAGLVHDLNNPLASLSSELHLLKHEQSIERIRDSLGTVTSHIDRINRTLRDVLRFSRRHSGQVANIRIEQVIRDALRLLRHDPRARNININRKLATELPRVRMVEDDLILVFINILINAFDAMPDGGELTIKSVLTDSGGIRLSVRDSGCGMNEEQVKLAIKPLYTTKAEGEGTGLGLPLCVDIMEAAGGSLEIESEPGKGSEVTLGFPLTSPA